MFFLTPQVLVNDLINAICPAADIKCVIVDEAHKALGNHAYCQVESSFCIIRDTEEAMLDYLVTMQQLADDQIYYFVC